jgi:hypothetical protein
VPIHAQLVRLGFLKFVEDVRRRDGEKAFLFPLLAVDKGRAGVKAYSKWFGRYLRRQGVPDTAKVFHSFRHGFKDALRQGKVNQEIHDALTGHAQASTVSGGYLKADLSTLRSVCHHCRCSVSLRRLNYLLPRSMMRAHLGWPRLKNWRRFGLLNRGGPSKRLMRPPFPFRSLHRYNRQFAQ